jgi:hypothetical protein
MLLCQEKGLKTQKGKKYFLSRKKHPFSHTPKRDVFSIKEAKSCSLVVCFFYGLADEECREERKDVCLK